MEKSITSNIIRLEPPYNIIKHGNKIGIQIGIQTVTVVCHSPFQTETHRCPVVAAENSAYALPGKKFMVDGSSDIEVWDNVAPERVLILCSLDKQLTWQEFITILWKDHDHSRDCRQRIQKEYIFRKLMKYYGSMMLPSPDLYTIHLHTESWGDGPTVVCSAREDVFALNVEWTDDPAALEGRVVEDLLGYVHLSNGGQLRIGRLTYETTEEALHPVVERLNANQRATTLRNVVGGGVTVTAIMPYEDEEPLPQSSGESQQSEEKIEQTVVDEFAQLLKTRDKVLSLSILKEAQQLTDPKIADLLVCHKNDFKEGIMISDIHKILQKGGLYTAGVTNLRAALRKKGWYENE